MKKLSLFLLVPVFAFCGCSDENGEVEGGDDNKGGESEKKEVIASFKNQLTESESEFTSTNTEASRYYFKDTFTDSESYITFDHYYSDWGQEYSFVGFAYTDEASHFQDCQPNHGNIEAGEVYLGVYSDGNIIVSMIAIDSQYPIKDLQITTSKNTYIGMTGGGSYTRPFKKGDWCKAAATGYDNRGKKIAETKIKLADYKTDTNKSVNTWIWFDLAPLKDASKIILIPSFPDSGELRVNTGKYFRIDDPTPIGK